MGDVFKTMTAGFSRFVMAWIVPSVATLAIFSIFLYPELLGNPVLAPIAKVASTGRIQAVLVFVFGALLLSLLFSLGGLSLYRLLEGYTLPSPLRRSWTRSEARRMLRLQRMYRLTPAARVAERGQLKEQLVLYPTRRAEILPTRLGNAFKAVETYGDRQFSLDSQAFHFELSGVAPDRLERDLEDTRAQVDFFLGFVGQLGLLAAISIVTAVGKTSGIALALALVSALLARLAYRAAIKNMTDLRYAVQARVHIGRPSLAVALGYRLPSSLERERRMWAAWTNFVERGDASGLQKMDRYRLRSSDLSGNTPS